MVVGASSRLVQPAPYSVSKGGKAAGRARENRAISNTIFLIKGEVMVPASGTLQTNKAIFFY